MPHHVEALERLLTRQQVADLLGVHKETVKRLERAGKLAAHKLGYRATRYSPAEVQRWLKETEYRANR